MNDPFSEATWRLVEWHCDDGHGWLRVPLELVPDGLNISEYSYRDSEFAYLEEDCDAGTWIESWQAGSPIDNLDRLTQLHGSIDNVPNVCHAGGAFIRRLEHWRNPNYASPFRTGT